MTHSAKDAALKLPSSHFLSCEKKSFCFSISLRSNSSKGSLFWVVLSLRWSIYHRAKNSSATKTNGICSWHQPDLKKFSVKSYKNVWSNKTSINLYFQQNAWTFHQNCWNCRKKNYLSVKLEKRATSCFITQYKKFNFKFTEKLNFRVESIKCH